MTDLVRLWAGAQDRPDLLLPLLALLTLAAAALAGLLAAILEEMRTA